MYTVNTTIPVLVTGATGYVASWIVKFLLEAGATVHATVRDPENKAKVQHLFDMAESTPGTIKLFKADLIDDGSYADAMSGVGIVFHTASPFILGFEDEQKDLIDPAVNGTKNVLDEASRTVSVTRVVLTSSTAAIGTMDDMKRYLDGVLTEASWNESSTLETAPYIVSKVQAERRAWEISESASWELVVLNPGLVVGPSISSSTTSASFDLVRMLGDGTFQNVTSGVPALSLGIVDVRDVAYAHLSAAYLPSVQGRFILFSSVSSVIELADIIRDNIGAGFPLPPTLISHGMTWKGDNTRSKEILGVDYQPVDNAVKEMFSQLVDRGLIQKPEKPISADA